MNVDTTNDRLYYGYNEDGPAVTDPDLDIVYWSVEVQTVSTDSYELGITSYELRRALFSVTRNS